MRNSIFILILLSIFASLPTLAGERKWTTQEKLHNGDSLVLYWAGVYEGSDTVYKITKGNKILDLGKRNAAGQPTLNLKHNFIALPYCADDGCLSTVNIVELSDFKILPPIELGYTGQFYITCKWDDTILEIQVEHEPWGRSKGSFTKHKYQVTTQGISIIKGKNEI